VVFIASSRQDIEITSGHRKKRKYMKKKVEREREKGGKERKAYANC
jgi:hypothetical protein